MEPVIRYARTADGVSIAYLTLGSGRPLLITPPLGFSHLQLEFAYAPLRNWYERLAENRTVIRFDWRGQGLSQRNLADFPIDGFLDDIDAVVADLGLERVDIVGCGSVGFAACDYAYSRPGRVRSLILWSVPADGEVWGSAQVEASFTLAEKDYVAFTETLAASILGWNDPIAAHQWARFIRRSMSEDDHRRWISTRPNVTNRRDAAATLAGIRAPTLVIHPSGMRNMAVGNAQTLASSIPSAKLILTTDNLSGLPTGEQALAAIEDFLGGERSAPPRPRDGAAPSATAVVLFTDIADSTALTERMGDAAFRAASRRIDDDVRAAIRDAGGQPVAGKVLGDGVMGVFTSATQAIQAAQRCVEAVGDLPLHIGLHAGDVLREDDNVYGGAVNIASRICGLSEPGEIIVSQTVRDLARTSAGVTFEDRGEQMLKGIEDPVRVFAVRPGP